MSNSLRIMVFCTQHLGHNVKLPSGCSGASICYRTGHAISCNLEKRQKSPRTAFWSFQGPLRNHNTSCEHPDRSVYHPGPPPDPTGPIKRVLGAARHIPRSPSTRLRPRRAEQATRSRARPPTRRRTCPRCRLSGAALGPDHTPAGCTLQAGWSTHQAT